MADLDILPWEQMPRSVKFDATFTIILRHRLLPKDGSFKETIMTHKDMYMRYKAKPELRKIKLRSVSR